MDLVMRGEKGEGERKTKEAKREDKGETECLAELAGLCETEKLGEGSPFRVGAGQEEPR